MGSASRSVFAHSDVTVGIRRHPRRLFSVPITLHYLGSRGVRTTRGISLNISEGGLGALVQGKLQLGDMVAIDFFLHERSLSTVAIVRHTSNVQSGFEFLGLTADERQEITNITAIA